MCRFVFGRVVAAQPHCTGNLPRLLAFCLSVFLALGGGSAFGAALTWDPAGTGTFGGGGTWTTSTATKNWWNGTTTAAWANGNDAWFTGPTAAGGVTVSNPVSVNNLYFTENGYSLNITTSANTLTLTGGSVTVSTGTATINADLLGSATLTMLGPGALSLGFSQNGFTGPVVINGGMLVTNATNTGKASLGNASSITVNSGGTLATGTAANTLIGSPGSAGKTMTINAGGLLYDGGTNTYHVNQLVLNGGTVSAAGNNTADGSWNLDGGVSTSGSGTTSYMLGGGAALTSSATLGGTGFTIGSGDTLYDTTQLYAATGFAASNQFGLVKAGAGALILAGSNNFVNGTNVNAGTLLLANTAALAVSPLSISAGTVSFSGINSLAVVSLAGNAAGTLLLTNSTDSSSANLTVANTAAAISTAYNGTLTGSGGSLTMNGPGTLTLGGSNNYTGTTSLGGGVLVLNNSAALAGGGSINFTGGTLRFSANNTIDYSSQFLTTNNQAVKIDTNGQSVTLAANLTSSGGSLTKLGAGQLTLSGTNSYSGVTAINAGVLQFASASAVPNSGSGNGQVIINNGGALAAISGDDVTVNGWLGTGDIATASAGAIAISASSTDTGVDFTSGPGYPTLALGAVGTVTYNGTINPFSQATGYYLGGSGTLWLPNALNDAGGPTPLTIVNGGTVVIANSASAWSGPTSIQPGATLQLGDSSGNNVTPVASISNSGTLIFRNASPQTIATGINGTAGSSLFAFGSSVLEIDGTNSVGILSANGGTLNIGTSVPGTTIFNTVGKTVIGTNLASAPRGPEVVNWNATGAFSGGGFFGVADTGQTATFNMLGGSLAVSNVKVFIGNGGGGTAAVSNGTFNMTAGTVTVDASNPFYISSISSGATNAFGNGTLNVTGGSMYIGQGGTFGLGNNFAITMAWGNNTSATVNLTGGTLSTARGFMGGSGTATVNLNGGVLECPAVNSSGDWFDGVTVVAGTNGAFLDVEGAQFAKVTVSPITGPGTLTKLGPGGLFLYTANSYQGGTVVNSGQLAAASDASLGAVPSSFVANNITLNGGELSNLTSGTSGTNLIVSANRGIFLGPNGGYLTFSGSAGSTANTTQVNGVIGGGGTLTIANGGQGFVGNNVYLANVANTYSGATAIGTPQLGGFVDIGAIATLNVSKLANGGLPSSIGASISNASNLVFNSGSGGLATLAYVGTGDSTDRLFTIASGNAAINSSGSGALSFTNTGAIVFTNANASTLALGGTYAGPNANTFAPAITDNGPLPTTVAVNGSLWTLTGGNNNTFTGGVVLNGGTLNVTSNNQLQSNLVTVYGGNLAFAAGVTSGTLGGLGGNAGRIVLQDANSSAVTLYVGANNNSTAFDGTLTGPGGLFKTGSGMLTLSASQSYAGATVVNSGTLQISSPAGPSGFGGNGAGWTLKNAGNSAVGVYNNVLTLTQNGIGNTATALWYNTPLPLAGSAWTANFTYNDSSGSGADGGSLALQTSTTGVNALGGNGGNKGISGITPSAELVWNVFNTSTGSIGYNTGGGVTTTGALAFNTSPVRIVAANTPTNFTVSYDGAGNLTLTATQGANTISKTVPSNLLSVLTGMGGYAYLGFTGGDGSTTSTQLISNFSLTYSPTTSVNVLPVNTPLTVNANGTFDLNGGSQAIGSLAGAGLVTNSLAITTAALTLGNDGSSQTFSGAISGNLTVTKVGSGFQTFSGANSYTGGTTINGGDLMFASVGSLPATGSININYGGGVVAQGVYANVNSWLTASPAPITTSSSGAIVLTPSSPDTDVNFATPGYNSLSLGALGAVTYNGTIEPGTNGYYLGGGGGTLTMANPVNDYNASPTALTINGPGMVVLSASPGYTGNTTVNTGAVLDLGGNTLTIGAGAALALQGGTLQDGTLNSSQDYIIQSGLVSANLAGPVNLFKTTAGSATLTGANSYTGVTNINGGILNLGSTGAIPSGGTITFGGGTMQFSSANTTDYSAQILGSTAPISLDLNGQSVTLATPLSTSNIGGLTVSGASGTLDLGGNVETMSGTVSFQGGVVTQSGTISENTTAYDGRSGTVTAVLAGNVGLNKITAGILNLNAVNTYSGSTTLTAGILSLGNNAALGSGTLALNGGTLEAGTALSGVPNPVVVLANATLGGLNNFTLSGSLTNSGANHTLTVANTGSVVTISGNIYLSESQGTAHGLTFNSNVANTALVLSGNIADSAAGATSGTPGTSLTIQPNQPGDTVLVSGTNSYTGTTSLGGAAKGVITITNSAAFSTGTVTLNQTQFATSTNLALNNAFTDTGNNPQVFVGTNNVTINGAFTNAANASFLNNGSGLLTLAGNVYLTASAGSVNTLTLGGSGTTVVSGPIANFNGTSGTVDSLAFSGTGGGILFITGTNNSYTGITAISAGTVNVGSLSNYGSNSSLGNRLALSETAAGDGIGIHIGSTTNGATLQYTGSTAQSTNRQIRLSAANNTIDASGSVPSATMNFTYSGTNINLFDTGGTRSLTLTGSNTGLNLFAINLTNQGANAISLIKNGVGTWVVSNTASSFSGGTTINAGTLIAQAPAAFGAIGSALNLAGGTLDLQTDSSINALNTTVSGNATIVSDKLTPSSAGITQNLGSLSIGTDTLSIAQGANVSGGSPAVTFSGATTLTGSATFSPAAGTTLTLSGSVNGAFGINMSGAGTMVLSGTNTYTGGTVVANGTLIATNSQALLDGTSLTVGDAGAFAPVVPFNAPQAAAPVSSVPEPGTLVLVAGAIALLGYGLRRRKKA